MSVTAAKGFLAAGIAAGLKKNNQLDYGLLVSDCDAVAAAMFTTNKIKAAPVVLAQRHLQQNHPGRRAILVNSKCANACTGSRGMADASELCNQAAALLALEPGQVLPASTGVIGSFLPLPAMTEHLPALVAAVSTQGGGDFAAAILTTDTGVKESYCTGMIAEQPFVIGGCCKGSGMIAPQMDVLPSATLLVFLTTDVAISAALLQKCLRQAVMKSFNRVVVDGDTSTNDTVYILANGASGVVIREDNCQLFQKKLDDVCYQLSLQVAADGEGATKLIKINISGCGSVSDAELIGRAIAQSPLVKTAFFGEDANWGRIIAAIGYSGANFAPETIALKIASAAGELYLCRQGGAAAFDEQFAGKILQEKCLELSVEMNNGDCEAVFLSCDFSYDYIRINGDYRS